MEPNNPHQSRPHPHLHNILPPLSSQLAQQLAQHFPHRSANSTPVSSPGLFSPANSRTNMSFPSVSEGTTTPAGGNNSPYLHPLHIVKETHKALVDTDFATGRKLINQYEIIDELGRGVHGKVKLARDLNNGGHVAIKIIPRFSKKRRLGKVTAMSTQDKSRKEIAILKKIRHPNVVALLEVIDDPELKKIYMVLEHVELGEIVWRKKGMPHICSYERRRVEREMRGDIPTQEEEKYELTLERRQAVKDAKRARMSQIQSVNAEYWSLEYGPATDEEDAESQARSLDLTTRSIPSNSEFLVRSRATSRAPSRTHSYRSASRAGTPHPAELEPDLAPEPEPEPIPNEEDMETPGPLRSNPAASTALDGSMYGAYDDVPLPLRGRSPSMPDSIISHMSSVDYNRAIDPYADDYSYVPCFTFEQARSSFRDTVLGVEYLHYEGVVHRDIKPANLLWTRDHRVKISDFGVSYFGRPIRYGEPDDTISESEARDFDNDLELSKTVGTPAFFAPELCYTDALDEQPYQPQPKVTEQIDVWSLGVTLYCLIFARIPFLAEDEWQMFRKIATEDVYIPTKRLRPVDPSTKPDEESHYGRVSNVGGVYRNDDELAYEDVEPELQDLLRRMLTKQPDKRIKLRDVKRHSWVTKGLPNVIAWLDDTEPARRTSGRKIQVDEREMAHAVVPLTFLERAKSTIKKTFGKVMHPRGDRGESSSRRRATSSAASSAGDSPSNAPSTPYPRDNRRRSLRGDIRGDDYFAALKGHQPSGEHPLTHSVTASPYESPVDGDGLVAPNLQQPNTQRGPHGNGNGYTRPASTDPIADRQAKLGTQKPLPPLPRHAHARSVTNAFFGSNPPSFHESRTVPPTPCFDNALSSQEDPSNTLRKARDMRASADDTSRARSVDRGLFASNDKRAEPKVSLSTAVAPGAVEIPRPRSIRPSDLSKHPYGTPYASPLLPPSAATAATAAQTITGYPHSQPLHDCQRAYLFNDRPSTAHRIEDVPEDETPPLHMYHNAETPEEFAHARELMIHRQYFDQDEINRQHILEAEAEFDPSMIPCPPSPDEDIFSRPLRRPSREETIGTGTTLSSNSASMGNLTTPLTSPSEMASPLCLANPIPLKDHNTELILAFQSDPSLPALLSSTSSVSADPEGDFLGNPGVVPRASLIDTTDSLTPPALNKEPIAGFPLEEHMQMMDGAVAVRPDSAHRPHIIVNPSVDATAAVPRTMDDEDEESDSDEGLTMMAKSKKRHSKGSSHASMGKIMMGAKRRDTNCSVGSTDTAKKFVVQTD